MNEKEMTALCTPVGAGAGSQIKKYVPSLLNRLCRKYQPLSYERSRLKFGKD